jgi:release factor glutamine methyltransferase
VGIQKKIRGLLHPVLKPVFHWYLSKPRTYYFKNISVKVNPTVFHPGFFFSTKLLLKFLSNRQLKNKKILELGAGTGLISLHCAKQGAIVTATDISHPALQNIKENAEINRVDITIIHSDLFANVSPNNFDIIIINPPYYPKKIETEKDYAWFCGENFEYFQRLFYQISKQSNILSEILIILSEDCEISKIKAIAREQQLELVMVHKKKILGEWNYIFHLQYMRSPVH